MEPQLQHQDDFEPTVDIAQIARVNRGDRVEVGGVRDATLELFEQTLVLVREELGDADDAVSPAPRRESGPPTPGS